jgi:hypothetical protein
MKKKILLVATVILISVGMLSISKVVQEKYLNKKNASIQKDISTNDPELEKQPNFMIKDGISGKTILSLRLNTENRNVGEITLQELDNNGINYKPSGRGKVLYFTMINDLKARDNGPLSGWCYFVNGVKPGISCGAYKLKNGDVIEWKYLKDGVNN